MNGANPHLDENLLRVFYTLSEITGDKRYAKVAEEELTWFFNHTMSPKTGLLPWGEHLSWDVMFDAPISGGGDWCALPEDLVKRLDELCEVM